MKLIMFSTDRKIFDTDSDVRSRLIEQASLVDELHVIVFSVRKAHFQVETIGKNIHLYPTASLFRGGYLFAAVRIACRIISAQKNDFLLTTQDPFDTGLAGYITKLIKRVNLHVQIHTDPFSVYWRNHSPVNWVRMLITLLVLQRADGVRVVSERVEKAVQEIGVDPTIITRVPVFVDISRFHGMEELADIKSQYPSYGRIILSNGRLEKEKNFVQLVNIFKDIRNVYEDALLIIVGSGSQYDHLVAQAEWHGVEDHIRFLPWSHDLRSYYRAADVYVQPSLYEGWGMSVVEALAARTPVVMTDVGCAGEVVVNEVSGLVVPPGNGAALKDAILRILGDTELRNRLVEGGIDVIAKLPNKEETYEQYRVSYERAFAKNK